MDSCCVIVNGIDQNLYRGKIAAAAGIAPYQAAVKPESKLSEEDGKLIRGFKPPSIVLPYPVKMNEHLNQARKETHEWLRKHGVDVLFGNYFETILKEDSIELPCGIFPDAGLQEITFASKYFFWLFLVDHCMDDCDLGMSIKTALPVLLDLNLVLLCSFPDDRVLYDNMMAAVDAFVPAESRAEVLDFMDLQNARTTPGYNRKAGPLASTLRDLTETHSKGAAKSSSLRLAHIIQNYLLGLLAESQDREENIIPKISQYILIRRVVGIPEIAWGLVDYMHHVTSPEDLMSSPIMRSMDEAHQDIICWHNDLWSFKKEALKGDVYNMVFLVSHEHNLSFDDAALYTTKMIMDRLDDFKKGSDELRATSPSDYEQVISAYIVTAENFFVSTDKWHSESIRFQ